MQFDQRLLEHYEILKNTICSHLQEEISIEEACQQFQNMLLETKKQKGTVYVIGNGGSAAIALHFQVDLIKANSIFASTLYDASTLTCLSNDFGYASSFSYPLELSLKQHDLLVAISSSGNSPNIVHALDVAKNKDIRIIGLSGFSEENSLKKRADLSFWIPISDYGLVELGHMFILHYITDSLQCEKEKINQREYVYSTE